jgi:hypothetical protein
MSYTVYEGSTVRFYTSTPFTSISGTAVDPDTVTFSYQVQGQNTISFTYTWGTGDPTNTIVRDGVGLYHADVDTTGRAGIYSWRWFGAPSSVAHDTTKTQVATEGTVTVSIQNL